MNDMGLRVPTVMSDKAKTSECEFTFFSYLVKKPNL